MSKTKNLTPDEIVAADNLKRIWNEKKRERNLTQENVAPSIGVTTQGAVGHYLNKKAALSADKVILFARVLGVEPDQIDPRLKGVPMGSSTLEDTQGLSEEQLELLDLFASSRPKVQQAVLALLEAENEPKRAGARRMPDKLKTPDQSQSQNNQSDT